MTTTPRPLLLLEVLIAALAAMTIKALISLVLWRYAGPLTLLIVLSGLTVYLHWRGLGWRSFGLIKLPKLKSWLLLPLQALLGVVVILATGVGSASIGTALGFEFMGQEPAGVTDRFGAVADGSLPHYLLWLAISILAAGLGEELFFRGYMINRLRDALGSGVVMTAVSVILPALYFGYGHVYYQGLRGLITTGLIGLSLGLLFLIYKRNLWPLVIAHAAVDCLVFTALYFNLDI
ncbi:CPBP family intramembrane glutamic endopeptidase [Oceanicaulis sp. UBA2681]|uniref:CPBP family intramembrane glutamic endopeptidase n=1 Tax=Oceanicaulis sp. UBA2681 TaxID=1947007 RepID=UPI000ED35452|nr:type II CAAX endopeptidase family protein [Oceanicaulis sp. UBA2681]HCR67218.1 CPBP family intramembrane metalloprotease [Oceanicaulis sp.]|tara:strand:- start:1436 stop:2140 length:705 start_codon:yes stop_codon:yes gene_type:complete